MWMIGTDWASSIDKAIESQPEREGITHLPELDSTFQILRHQSEFLENQRVDIYLSTVNRWSSTITASS